MLTISKFSEPKTVKDRLHLDLISHMCTAALENLVALVATVVNEISGTVGT